MSKAVSVQREGEGIEIRVRIDLRPGASMMEMEEAILGGLNEAGRQATGQCLKDFDTDGSPIEVAGMGLTTKGEVTKNYQSPYGEVAVERHVYQSSAGGATYCPLDVSARIVNSTTPRFARMCARKYAAMKSTLAQADLEESHGRKVSRCYLQDIAEEVALIAQARQERWKYADPDLGRVVRTVAVGIDGTCVLYCEEGWRQAMVGTLSLYDHAGERLHTIYVAAPPEYGKARFLQQMEREIARCKERYSWARWVGVADGAKDFWPWLERFTDEQILDYFHAASYLDQAAPGVCGRAQQEDWRQQSAHSLQHNHAAAAAILMEMRQALQTRRLGASVKKDLEGAIGYFENNLARMNYARHREANLPIGSGVTEAACKTVVKERMSGSGMKWKNSGAATVLNLRSLILTQSRWDQFWAKIIQFGV